MTKIEFTVPIDPIGKGRPRFSTVAGHAIAYTPKKTKDAESIIRLYARRAMGNEYPPERGTPFRVSIKAFFEIPASYSKRRHELCLKGLERPCKKPDIDNVVKLVLDSLNEFVFWDDKDIVELSISKHYAEKARIEIVCEVLN